MNAQEFIAAVDDGDFLQICKDKVNEFFNFVNEAVEERRNRVVLRCATELDDENVPLPYYIWVVFHLFSDLDGTNIGLAPCDIYIPEEERVEGYLIVPDDLEGEKYFEVSI